MSRARKRNNGASARRGIRSPIRGTLPIRAEREIARNKRYTGLTTFQGGFAIWVNGKDVGTIEKHALLPNEPLARFAKPGEKVARIAIASVGSGTREMKAREKARLMIRAMQVATHPEIVSRLKKQRVACIAGISRNAALLRFASSRWPVIIIPGERDPLARLRRMTEAAYGRQIIPGKYANNQYSLIVIPIRLLEKYLRAPPEEKQAILDVVNANNRRTQLQTTTPARKPSA